MKSFKMKALAVAVLGLAGMGMMGSAFAVTCPDPTGPNPGDNQGYAQPNGPWFGQTVSGASMVSFSPGLNGTNCQMRVAFVPVGGVTAGSALATVTDNSGQNEQRYRARFYVDLSNLSAQFATDGSQSQVQLMNAVANSAPTGANPSLVRVSLLGGSPPQFRFAVADTGAGGNFKIILVTAPNPTGVNRIEFDYNTGTSSACAPGNAHGSFCLWVNNGADASGADATPVPASVQATHTNPYSLLAGSFDPTGTTGWSGEALANLGISTPSFTLQTSTAASQVIGLDEFDSRRQTFIGK